MLEKIGKGLEKETARQESDFGKQCMKKGGKLLIKK